GHTYSANPLCCAAALANLDVFVEEKTLDRLQPKIQELTQLLEPLDDHPHVGDIRQRGFMVGIELVKDRNTKQSFPEQEQVGVKVVVAARKHGIIVRNLSDVIVLMPPLAIQQEQLVQLVLGVRAAISEVCRSEVCDA
ncbi:MAG: aminotransferase class III-fold pyridoxal phosphate-dependent enzyme, partial [Planctomycetota bacterium]